MTTIIAGRFQTSDQAQQAVEALAAKSVARDRISVFFVTPPGQHDATPIGGDEHQSEGMEDTGKGAAGGAALGASVGIAGALIGATAGLAAPMVAIAGVGAAAAGAFSGSLAGAMNATSDPGQSQIRHAGMMVCVDAGEAAPGVTQDDIVAALQDAGGVDLESAEGIWADGTWEDFDATSPPALIHQSAPLAPAAPSN